MNERFGIAVVCTGNRFRSPIAEAFLRDLTTGLPVDVSSFGTLELEDLPAFPEALELAPSLGIELAGHRARCVRGAELGSTDLVLGFERHHVAAAVVDAGAARERTFLLPALVALLDGLPKPAGLDALERARDRIRLADERRAEAADADREPELADPVDGPRSAFAATARELERLCRLLAARLFA